MGRLSTLGPGEDSPLFTTVAGVADRLETPIECAGSSAVRRVLPSSTPARLCPDRAGALSRPQKTTIASGGIAGPRPLPRRDECLPRRAFRVQRTRADAVPAGSPLPPCPQVRRLDPMSPILDEIRHSDVHRGNRWIDGIDQCLAAGGRAFRSSRPAAGRFSDFTRQLKVDYRARRYGPEPKQGSCSPIHALDGWRSA